MPDAGSEAWSAPAYLVLVGRVGGFDPRFWHVSHCAAARPAPIQLLQSLFAIAAGVIFRHEPPALVLRALVCVGGGPSRNVRRQAARGLEVDRQAFGVVRHPDWLKQLG